MKCGAYVKRHGLSGTGVPLFTADGQAMLDTSGKDPILRQMTGHMHPDASPQAGAIAQGIMLDKYLHGTQTPSESDPGDSASRLGTK